MRLSHRAHTTATPAEVWPLLADPARWSTFDLLVRRVRGRAGKVAPGQRLVALGRFLSLHVPVDVLEVVPEQRLVLLVHTLPGVRQQVTVDLVPAVRGGTEVTVSGVVDGLFAVPAALPLWLVDGLTVRVLAARSDRDARAARGAGRRSA